MEFEAPQSWEELRQQKPLNEQRVATYRQLMEAQEQLGAMRAVDVGEAAVEAALEASLSPAPESESEEELYVGTLTRFIEALGGQAVPLEKLVGIRAQFDGWSVAVPGFTR